MAENEPPPQGATLAESSSGEAEVYRPGVEARRDGLAAGLVAAMLVAGWLALPRLPARVPVHWNAQGQVNGWGSPLAAAFLPPLLALGAVHFCGIKRREQRFGHASPAYVAAAVDGERTPPNDLGRGGGSEG